MFYDKMLAGKIYNGMGAKVPSMEIKICTFARTDKDVTVTGKTVYRQRSKERNKIANKENTKVDPNIKKIQSGSGGGVRAGVDKQNKDSSDFKEPVRQREAERLGGKKRKRKGWFGKKEKEEDMRQQLKGS